MSSMVVLDSGSDISETTSEGNCEEKDTSDMYDVMKSFLMNNKNENVANILTNLTNEIKRLCDVIETKTQ